MAGYKKMCPQGTCGSARERCYARSGGTLSPSRTLPIKTLTRKLLVLVSEVEDTAAAGGSNGGASVKSQTE